MDARRNVPNLTNPQHSTPRRRRRQRPRPRGRSHRVQLERSYRQVSKRGLNKPRTPLTASFDNMELKADLLRGVYAYGFERPSAIQQRAIKPIITGRDCIAQAQSGTGKTATFSVSILQRVSALRA